MKHLLEYLGDTLKIETKDGRVIEGEAISYSCAIELDADFDEIVLRTRPQHGEAVSEDEIKSITVL